MKNFKNPVPLQYNIEDIDGKPKVLTSVLMTPKKFRKLDEIGIDEKLDIYSRGTAQMAVIFGGDAKDYENIEQRILKAVLSDWQTEIGNPLMESKEK
jgi:hypothetical protein